MNWNFEDGRIYCTDEQGELVCEATYTNTGERRINIDHTFVNPKLRGQSVAAQLMKQVAEFIRKEKLKTSATCSYASIWLKRHQDSYADILAEDFGDQAVACRIDAKH